MTMRNTVFGAAIAALAAFACLWVAGASDPATCSLAELADRESVLMSCEETSPVSAVLLWCADPDSPQCIPALPQAPRLELWDRADAALSLPPELPHLGYTWMTWPEPLIADMPGRVPTLRLERPPRA